MFPDCSLCAGHTSCDITEGKHQDRQCYEGTPGAGSVVGVLVQPFTPMTLDKLSPSLAADTRGAFTLC